MAGIPRIPRHIRIPGGIPAEYHKREYQAYKNAGLCLITWPCRAAPTLAFKITHIRPFDDARARAAPTLGPGGCHQAGLGFWQKFRCLYIAIFYTVVTELSPSRDSLVVNASIPPNPFFLAIYCPDMVLSVGLAIVNPGFNYLLGLEAILLAARGGKEMRARAQQRSQGYFLLLARGAAAGACVLTRRNPKVAAVNPKVYFRGFRAGKRAARPPRSHGFWVGFCNICRKTMGL